MKTAADSSVVQHSFIYLCLEINFNPFKIDKGIFCHADQYAVFVQTTIFLLLKLLHAFFSTKFLLLHSEKNSIHASIMNNGIGAFKQEKNK